MATYNKATLKASIAANPTLTAAEKIILSDMVDSYEDYAPQIDTVQRDAIVGPVLAQRIFNTDAARFEYWDGSRWFGFGQNVSTPLVVQVDLTSADILALNGTDIVVAAAPGAGFALIPSSMVYRFTFGSVAYTSGGGTQGINLLHSGNTIANQPYMKIADLAIKASANRSGALGPSTGSSANTLRENEGLVLRADQAWLNGDGTLTVWVTYSLINF